MSRRKPATSLPLQRPHGVAVPTVVTRRRAISLLAAMLLIGHAGGARAGDIVDADAIVGALSESIFDDPTRSLPDAQKPTVLLSVEFDLGSADLTAAGRRQLDELAQAMARPAGNMDKGIFRIEGHTDSRGGEDLNQRLSERRADAVVRYLVDAHRVAPARLDVVGYGETRPLVPDDPEAAANRRVEVRRLGSLP